MIRRKSWKLMMLAALAGLCPRVGLACAVCAGGKTDSALADGMNMGILTLLGVVVTVLGGIAGFFIYLASHGASVAAQNAVPVLISETDKT